MKVLKTIKKIVMGPVIFVFSIFALVMTILLLNFNKYGVTEFGDKSLIIIRQKISSDKYKFGDLVIVEDVDFDLIEKGDEIFAYRVNGKGEPTVDLGIVGQLYPKDRTIAYENSSSFSEEYIIGKAVKTYNDIGKYLAIIESKWGFLFMVLVPCFIIFIYEIYALIIEIRYGDEE